LTAPRCVDKAEQVSGLRAAAAKLNFADQL
jgi:hypothetical protein